MVDDQGFNLKSFAEERRGGARGGWMEGRKEGENWKRRRGNLALSGTAGLQISDPWCPGFQSGGGPEREERRHQHGSSNILSERKKCPKKVFGEKCARSEEKGDEGTTQ